MAGFPIITGQLHMQPLVGLIMGSKSDWPTMEHAAEMLEKLGVAYETRVVSAHRTPDLLFDYAKTASDRGLKVIIAGAGGAAHLPGMVASQTSLPVLGVPVQSKALNGLDSLLSIVQMPGGIAVGTLAIGKAGATNAGLLAAQIIGTHDDSVRKAVDEFRATETQTLLDKPDPKDQWSQLEDQTSRPGEALQNCAEPWMAEPKRHMGLAERL